MGSGASKRKSPAASGDRRGETAAAFVHRSQRQELVDQRPSQSPAACHTGDRTPIFQTASVSSSVPRGHSSPDMPRNCTVCSDCSLKIGLFKKKVSLKLDFRLSVSKWHHA